MWRSIQQALSDFPAYKLLSQRYPVVVAKGNIVGRVEKWGNGRRLLHEQSGDQLVVTGHRHTTAITQLDVQTFRQIIL